MNEKKSRRPFVKIKFFYPAASRCCPARLGTGDAGDVRIYVDADILGLGKILAGLRHDVTYPSDPGAVIQKRQRAPRSITSPDVLDTDWIPQVAARPTPVPHPALMPVLPVSGLPDGWTGNIVEKDCVSHNRVVDDIRFSATARKHGVSKTSVLYVMNTTEPEEQPTAGGSTGYFYRGRDAGGREIEVIVVDVTKDGQPAWLITHAMPTSLNKGKTRKKMLRRGKRKGKGKGQR